MLLGVKHKYLLSGLSLLALGFISPVSLVWGGGGGGGCVHICLRPSAGFQGTVAAELAFSVGEMQRSI